MHWLVFVCSLLLSSPAQLDGPKLDERIDEIVTRHLRQSGVPGVVVAVTQGQEVVILRGWGLADIEREVAMDPHRSRLRIASLSKTFTATALAQLEDEGRVDLDTDVDEYLRHVALGRTFAEPVTLRHLLAHTSGTINFNTGRVSLEAPAPEDFEAFMARTMPPRLHPPGTATLYTNHGNALAGLVVEEVSGVPFAEHVRERILDPLGMDATSYAIDPDHPELAASYRIEEGEPVRQRYEHFLTLPASAVHSTAADMARYLIVHAGDGSLGGVELLSPAAIERMRTPHPTIHPKLPEYHYAFAPTHYGGHAARVHGGSVPAYLSRMAVFDAHGVGVFVAQNAFGDNVAGEVIEAVAAALPEPEPLEPPAERARGDGRPSDPDALVGRYRKLDKHETAAFTRARAVLSQPPLRVSLDEEGFVRVGGLRYYVTGKGSTGEGATDELVFEAIDEQGRPKTMVFVLDPDGREAAWVHIDRSSAFRPPWHGGRVLQIGAHLLALGLLLGGLGALLGQRSQPEPLRKLWLGLGLAVLIGLIVPQVYALLADAGQPVYTHPLRLGVPPWITALLWLPRLGALAGLFMIAKGPVTRANAALVAGAWLFVALDLYWSTPPPGLERVG